MAVEEEEDARGWYGSHDGELEQSDALVLLNYTTDIMLQRIAIGQGGFIGGGRNTIN